MEKRTVLNQETLIPIGAVVLLFSFSAWMTTVWANGIQTKEQLLKLEERQEREIDKTNYQLEKLNSKMDELLKEMRNGNGR